MVRKKTATGRRRAVRELRDSPARVNRRRPTRAKKRVSQGLTSPLGRCRFWVLGFKASIFQSIRRFKAMAMVRAPRSIPP